jgi:outer membrane protein TolC
MVYRFIPTATLLILVLASNSSAAAATSLRSYLEQFFQSQPTLRALEGDLQAVEARAWSLKYRFDSNLRFAPAYGEVIPSDAGQAFNLVGGLNQTLPYGTELSFDAQRNFATGGLGATPELSLSGRISQSLWRNAFGGRWRQEAFAESERARALRIEFDDARWGACVQGIRSYLTSWAFQEKDAIIRELVSASAELLKWSERAHRSRLIRKRELLTARADRLRVKEQNLQFQSEKRSAMGELAAQANLSAIPERLEAVSRETLPDWGDLTEEAIKSSRTLMAEQARLSSREAALDSARQEARVGFDVFAEAGRRDFNFSGLRTSSTFYQFGVEIGVPLFSPAARGAVREAIAARAAQEARVEEERREQIARLRTLRAEYDLTRERLKLFRERIEVYRQETKAARRDLEQSRVEIEDYLTTRDRWLNERLSELDAQVQYHLKGLEVGRFSSAVPAVCGGSGKKVGLKAIDRPTLPQPPVRRAGLKQGKKS